MTVVIMALLDLIQLAEREADYAERASARLSLLIVRSEVIARLVLAPLLLAEIPA